VIFFALDYWANKAMSKDIVQDACTTSSQKMLPCVQGEVLGRSANRFLLDLAEVSAKKK